MVTREIFQVEMPKISEWRLGNVGLCGSAIGHREDTGCEQKM